MECILYICLHVVLFGSYATKRSPFATKHNKVCLAFRCLGTSGHRNGPFFSWTTHAVPLPVGRNSSQSCQFLSWHSLGAGGCCSQDQLHNSYQWSSLTAGSYLLPSGNQYRSAGRSGTTLHQSQCCGWSPKSKYWQRLDCGLYIGSDNSIFL